MAIPIVNSRDLVNTWRILDDKLGNFRDRGLNFKFPYVGAFSQSVAEWFVRVYSDPGDTIFDPFCVCKDSMILLNQQDKIKIQDIANRKESQVDIFGESDYTDSVMNFDIERNRDDDRDDLIKTSHIGNFFVKDSIDMEIFEIKTRNRRLLHASGEHLFLIKDRNKLEWKKLKDIKFGDMVAIFPSIVHLDTHIDKDVVILNEQDIIKNTPEHVKIDKVLNELKDAGIIPLTNNNPKLYIIARLCGFIMSDGYINEYENKSGGIDTSIGSTSGSKYCLLDIYDDILNLGLDIGKHLIDVRIKKSKDEEWRACRCADIEMRSKTIYVLFKSLGIPTGKKTETTFDVPWWVHDCSKRVKQEFLGGFFGGDGFAISNSISEYAPGKFSSIIERGGFSQTKIPELEHSLSTYVSSIVKLLNEFGIKCGKPQIKRRNYRKDGSDTITYRVQLLIDHDNALKFLRYIGYRYDSFKLEKTYPIYEYLISKEKRIGINDYISKNCTFPKYERWLQTYSLDGILFDDVITVKKIEYKDKLYDVSVENTHNYIVNEFITHNSGRGTTAMQSLWTGRNIICNDLSPYSNVLCHSIMFVPYMRDVLIFIKNLEEYINSDNCRVSKDYAGKGSEDDAAKLYHENTFDQIIKLRNILNNHDILLGFGDDLFKGINLSNESNLKEIYTYRHEVVMFTRMVMSQLMLHSSQDMSFNGIKTRGTDNTYIKGILKYYKSLGESPKRVNIFENMRHYIEKMGLDELGARDKFAKLERRMITCDARKLDLPDKCADMIVTSPPYYANLNYGMANWLRIWSISGIGDPLVGNHISTDILEKQNNSEIYGKTYDRITDKAGGTVDNPMAYSNFTGWYLKELYRVLKDDACAVIVVGDYGNKRKVEAWRLVTDRAEVFGFKPVMVIMDELNKQTKSSTQFQAKHAGGKNDFDVCVILFKGNYQRKNNPEDIDFRWGAAFVDGVQLDIESAWSYA